MKFLDILGMSIGNLKRRKLRTFLTVLGVLIGTTSVVIMISLGLGLKDSMMKEIEAYGSMNDVEVIYNGDSTDRYITDEKIREFEEIECIESISPELYSQITLTQGKWEVMTHLIGLTDEDMAKIPVGEGRLPMTESGKLEMIVGNQVITDVYNNITFEYPYYDDNELADVDFMEGEFDLVFSAVDNYYVDSGGNLRFNGKVLKYPIVGMVEGDEHTYSAYSYGVYTNMDNLKSYLKKNYKGKVIPGQPTDKNGKPLKDFVYFRICVHVDSTENVDTVKSYFEDLGYQVYSQAEWMKQTQSMTNIIQIVLGAIGSISLIVAAIGIANTMTMSTYERTKEIGVMKVLGCRLSDIKNMFLTEAACIGFIGGCGGLLLAKIISLIANHLAAPMVSQAVELGNLTLSIIPMWLVLVSLVFASLVGMLAGYFPAVRATKLSPLAAIRNE